MILAGLLLLAIGLADVLRAVLPPARRWIGVALALAVAVFLGIGADAPLPTMLTVPATLLWVWLLPVRERGRAGFWPAVGLAVVCAAGLAVVPDTGRGGWLGAIWVVDSPAGPIGLAASILVVGVVVFLVESGNAVVRVALAVDDVSADGGAAPESDAATDAGAADDADVDSAVDAHTEPVAPPLKGGRLIGPIERVIVFALTLAAAYPLLAAFIAAKGIVRFPEISRDSGTGNRAEYFLIGSLVSWLLGLAGAAAVWWAFAS